MQSEVVVIGAGPAGLTAAYMLAKNNKSVTVLESDPEYVGGIARTVTYKGYCFDIGGHRFFSKSKMVEDFWTEILPDDMLTRPRSSRIYYRKNFFTYPLKVFDALSKLGIMESCLCVLSYLKACLIPVKRPRSFSDWVSNQFGKRLFSIFFKTYTEKVWGMRCEDISADWAVQRIQKLSLFTAVFNAMFPKRKSKKVIKTLIDSFRYPRKGPGMLWDACAKKVQECNGTLLMGSRVVSCRFDHEKQEWCVVYATTNGESKTIHCKQIISSAPTKELILDYIQSPLSTIVKNAAASLHYRDFLIVVLILKDKKQFDSNWIYIHDPEIDVARIQNFKSWSEEMVPDPDMCCYGMEYFCFKNDSLWDMTDQALIAKATQEIIKIGLATQADIHDGYVVRQPKAYPVYDEHYKQHVTTIREELETNYPTLHLVGRNGMHKYNNQDHAIMTAMLTVENMLSGEKKFDPWCVNQDAEYHEVAARDVPSHVS